MLPPILWLKMWCIVKSTIYNLRSKSTYLCSTYILRGFHEPRVLNCVGAAALVWMSRTWAAIAILHAENTYITLDWLADLSGRAEIVNRRHIGCWVRREVEGLFTCLKMRANIIYRAYFTILLYHPTIITKAFSLCVEHSFSSITKTYHCGMETTWRELWFPILVTLGPPFCKCYDMAILYIIRNPREKSENKKRLSS